jgi:hypothetical protein
MFRVDSEKQFLDAFRYRDRKHVELPPGIKFPLYVRDYYAWSDPQGVRAFLVFAPSGGRQFIGIAFRRDQSAGDRPSCMCDWCHTFGARDQVGLLTTDSSARKRVGVNLCLDLACAARIEDAADRSGRNPRTQMKALLERMDRFARDALGILPTSRDGRTAETPN